MKKFSFLPCNTQLIVLSLCILFSSCIKEKNLHKRDFKVTAKTFYRVSPTAPKPLSVNGIQYVGFAHFPGGGPGEATHIGNVKTYFNQLAYGVSPEAPPSGSVSAPLVDVPGYPVTGGPLPLIQAGDFTELASVISWLQIPSMVRGNIINHVIYNQKGEAIFTSAITGSGSTFPLSQTVVGFNGKALILGGRGKFRNATGEINYSGKFSVINPNDAEYNAEGWISY